MGYLCDEGWDIYVPYTSFKLKSGVNDVTHWMELPDYPKKEDSQPAHILGDEAVPIDISELQVRFNPKEWADKFCEKNKDLMERLSKR